MLALLPAHPANAKARTAVKIEPGPAAMSDDERAIEADSAAGAEHAVVLVEESDHNEDFGFGFELSYHVRAKVLSNEGRRLADVEIPLWTKDDKVTRWWGRTILPDGSVLELPQRELKQQELARVGKISVRSLRGALPGVVPGAVIDYGYKMRGSVLLMLHRVLLQREWPVRSLVYRWEPQKLFTAAYQLVHADGREIEVTKDARAIVVSARDLPAVAREPMMPPDEEVRAAAVFYYVSPWSDPSDFWNSEAKRIDEQVRHFNAKGDAIQQAVESMALAPDADLEYRLRASYDWLTRNVRNTWLRSVEELEAHHDDGSDEDSARVLLDSHQGSGLQLDLLYIGIARALGADANLILAVDRTDHYWNPSVLNLQQFDETLVALRVPAEGKDKLQVVDPGSGLPFGQVPWWVAGVRGLMATGEGAKSVAIAPSSPAQNMADTLVRIGFSAGNGSLTAQWTTKGYGQRGLTARRDLRSLTPDDRATALDDLCGASGTLDVTEATAPALEESASTFELDCTAELFGAGIGAEVTDYSLSFDGPWLERLPDLNAPARSQPVVLPYPKVDVVSIDVTAPEGFTPVEGPTPINFVTPQGGYSLIVQPTETGYHVDRSVTLPVLSIAPDDYAAFRKMLADIRQGDATALRFRRAGSAR